MQVFCKFFINHLLYTARTVRNSTFAFLKQKNTRTGDAGYRKVTFQSVLHGFSNKSLC